MAVLSRNVIASYHTYFLDVCQEENVLKCKAREGGVLQSEIFHVKRRRDENCVTVR
jgi:hypothetical protein